MKAVKDDLKELDLRCLPGHIAIIMDGNGRWAKRRKLPRILGHQAGLKAVRKIVEAAVEIKIPVLTLYAFSVDNWIRPAKEIELLMRLLKKYISEDLGKLKKGNVLLRIIGDISKFPDSTQKAIRKAVDSLRENNGLTLVLALNYGGRVEIVKAAQKLAERLKKRPAGSRDINEKEFEELLETGGLPDPDLLIRTSGEKRLSNFLLWQVSYTELYFTGKLWPDFNRRNFIEAIADFQKRKRRYGGL